MYLLSVFFHLVVFNRKLVFVWTLIFAFFFSVKTSAKGLLVCSYHIFLFLDLYKMSAKTKNKFLFNG